MTSAPLRPCPACARHARVSENNCPFCGAAFAESFRIAARPQAPSGRLTRAALYALGSGMLVLTPACASPPSGHAVEPPDGSSTEFEDASGVTTVALYGMAPFGFDASFVAAYGNPGLIIEVDDASSADPVDAGLNALCSTSDECGSGYTCLFPVGGGCAAQGHCESEGSCTAQATPAVYCVCGVGGLLELQCVTPDGYVERTTMGPCPGDGATDTGTDDTLDASSEAEAQP